MASACYLASGIWAAATGLAFATGGAGVGGRGLQMGRGDRHRSGAVSVRDEGPQSEQPRQKGLESLFVVYTLPVWESYQETSFWIMTGR